MRDFISKITFGFLMAQLLPVAVVCLLWKPSFGFFMLVPGCYLLTSFFLLDRIQLGSLFKAETTLREKSLDNDQSIMADSQ
jgi:hypothetical protein